MRKIINDTSKPLILLGSNACIYKVTEVCDMIGIQVAGIIDQDYYGNTKEICEIPVIDSEASFQDPVLLDHYRNNFNFFCAVNWRAEKTPITERNRHKRNTWLKTIHQYQLGCISIVDPNARISKHSTIGVGCFVDAHVMIEPRCTVGDFTNIYYNTFLGHDSHVGKNCVLQRQCLLTANVTVGNDCYFALAVKFMKPGASAGAGTFIHEGIYLRRGTLENEVVSQHAGNQRRVISYPS